MSQGKSKWLTLNKYFGNKTSDYKCKIKKVYGVMTKLQYCNSKSTHGQEKLVISIFAKINDNYNHNECEQLFT